MMSCAALAPGNILTSERTSTNRSLQTQRRQVTAEADHAPGARQLVARDAAWPQWAHVDTLLEQTGDDVRLDRRVGLRPRERAAHGETALVGEALEQRRGDQTLRGAMETDKDDGAIAHA